MNDPKKFAVVLAGCGVYDGAEIHEATLALYAIMNNNAVYEIFAPDIWQHHVINHLNGEESAEKRNVLVESARIARGKIKDMKDFNAADFDVLLFPGGFGAAKNLCNFAVKGAECEVNKDVEAAVMQMINRKKPIGAMCISPVILARLLNNAKLTIGNDPGTAVAIEKMGAHHQITGHAEVVVDKNYKIASTPCYMLDATILDIARSADNIVKALLKLI
ncbi:MAG: isoprenoid biosynthesis glyoxalase ElbB [Bacteroidia bacterium]|nr:isoprenoid biosynthesis glyoxalase ElbB [Bacteroidia bacterium]